MARRDPKSGVGGDPCVAFTSSACEPYLDCQRPDPQVGSHRNTLKAGFPFNFSSVMNYGGGGFPPGCTGADCMMARRDGQPFVPASSVTFGDASAVVEGHRESEGWSRFKPVPTSDPGEAQPLNMLIDKARKAVVELLDELGC